MNGIKAPCRHRLRNPDRPGGLEGFSLAGSLKGLATGRRLCRIVALEVTVELARAQALEPVGRGEEAYPRLRTRRSTHDRVGRAGDLLDGVLLRRLRRGVEAY